MLSLTSDASLLLDIADSPTRFAVDCMVAVAAVVAGIEGLHGVESQIVGVVMGPRHSRNGMRFKI